MAKITEVSADEEDEVEKRKSEPALNEKGEPMNFNEMLQKAAEMKTAQLKEKRREWEACPEWYRHTMVLAKAKL
eukprot:8711929-Pyramimonas_sp.AAC.1